MFGVMTNQKKLKICYIISFSMLTIFSISFLLMPISNVVTPEQSNVLHIVTGLIFWISALTGYFFLMFANLLNKRLAKKEKRHKKIHIFSNLPTTIADLIFIIGFFIFIFLNFTDLKEHYIVYINIFFIIEAFNIHLLCCRDIYRNINWIAE